MCPAEEVTPLPAVPQYKRDLDAGLTNVSRVQVMAVIEDARREFAGELGKSPTAQRYDVLARRIQAMDIALDCLSGRLRR